MERMREKLAEYASEGAAWPLAACILDPIRVSIICHGSARMLEVAGWFVRDGSAAGMDICRVKNKFSHCQAEIVGGYRHIQLCVVFRSHVHTLKNH